MQHRLTSGASGSSTQTAQNCTLEPESAARSCRSHASFQKLPASICDLCVHAVCLAKSVILESGPTWAGNASISTCCEFALRRRLQNPGQALHSSGSETASGRTAHTHPRVLRAWDPGVHSTGRGRQRPSDLAAGGAGRRSTPWSHRSGSPAPVLLPSVVITSPTKERHVQCVLELRRGVYLRTLEFKKSVI